MDTYWSFFAHTLKFHWIHIVVLYHWKHILVSLEKHCRIFIEVPMEKQCRIFIEVPLEKYWSSIGYILKFFCTHFKVLLETYRSVVPLETRCSFIVYIIHLVPFDTFLLQWKNIEVPLDTYWSSFAQTFRLHWRHIVVLYCNQCE